MNFDSSDHSDAQFAGKIKTQTFKQLRLERLLKSGAVIPASKLAETKELELQRVRDFEVAATDEECHRRSDKTRPGAAPHSLITTREPLED